MKSPVRTTIAGLLTLLIIPALAVATDALPLRAGDITAYLYNLPEGQTPVLTSRNLERLDLADVNFKGANLSNSDFFGADLSGADLSKANLANTRLDRITFTKARFDYATLDNSSMLRPSVSATLEIKLDDAPSFKAVSLKNARIFGRFAGVDFTGANLTNAMLAPISDSGLLEVIWRTDLTSANLQNVTFFNANLGQAKLSFANANGADFRNASLRDTDLTGVDFTNANFEGADLSGADLSGAIVTGANFDRVKLDDAKGLTTLKGLETARNASQLMR